jgi:hypothetical protein
VDDDEDIVGDVFEIPFRNPQAPQDAPQPTDLGGVDVGQ